MGFEVEPAASEEMWKQEKPGWFREIASGLDWVEHGVSEVGAWAGVRSMDLLPTSARYGSTVGRFTGRRPECENPRILEA